MIQRRDKKRTASAKRIQAAFLEDNHIDIEEIKNEGIVSQYRMKNYHPAIVSRKVYEDVQERFIDGGNRARHTKEPKIKVKFKPIKSGLLTGFVPIPSAVEKIDIEQLKEISKKQKSRRKQKC